VLSIAGDLVTPVFITEETFLNKLVRVGAIWVGVMLLMLLVAVIRICCREAKIEWGIFLTRNIKNAVCIAFYVTVQDLAFFCAANFFSPNFGSALGIVFLVIAVILAILGGMMLVWLTKVVNYEYQEHSEDKLYQY
jgi:ATP/ADP translocase